MTSSPKTIGILEPGFFDCDALVPVGFLCRRDIEQGADLAFGDHVLVIGTVRARARRLTRRVLDQLADFLLERHLAQQGFHPSVETGVIDTGADIGRRGRRVRLCLEGGAHQQGA